MQWYPAEPGTAVSPMDDQNGHVIDGTARARQWRRSRSEAHAGDEAEGGPRSDAPKSIAGSLLVPAGMLARTSAVQEPANTNAPACTPGAGAATDSAVADNRAQR